MMNDDLGPPQWWLVGTVSYDRATGQAKFHPESQHDSEPGALRYVREQNRARLESGTPPLVLFPRGLNVQLVLDDAIPIRTDLERDYAELGRAVKQARLEEISSAPEGSDADTGRGKVVSVSEWGWYRPMSREERLEVAERPNRVLNFDEAGERRGKEHPDTATDPQDEAKKDKRLEQDQGQEL
jgi:hypothetical protein